MYKKYTNIFSLQFSGLSGKWFSLIAFNSSLETTSSNGVSPNKELHLH